MNKLLKKTAAASAVAAALSLSTAAFANDTSSGIRGKIVGPEGNVAANTKITVIHTPSGSVKETVTNENGIYSLKGLRVGGPYMIVVDSDVFQDKTEEGVVLNLGEVYRLNMQLSPVGQAAETISVTGSYVGFDSTGGSSSYGTEDIARAPAFNRDLKDLVRNNPLAVVDSDGALSIGGQNPKFNSITVDGIGQNDDFGLNSGGYPTQSSPISLDAVEQISVNTSPFNTKVGGFSGGVVNAVTKSGTNEFKGTVFYEFQNDSLAGDPKLNRVVNRNGDNETFELGEESTWGATFSGPLIEDKLHFFVNYEQFKKTEPAAFGLGEGSNKSDVTQEQYDRFLSIIDKEYGLTDELAGDPENKDKKAIFKLDWNINDDHRADFTYQWQDNSSDRNHSDRADELVLKSNTYTLNTVNNNFAAHLYSNWSDDFSTEITLSHKNTEINSLTNSDIGQVNVNGVGYIREDEDAGIEGVSGSTIVFGTDAFRHANVAETKTLKFNFDANYLVGDHEINFGYHYERLNNYNLFAESSLGVWTFGSDHDRFGVDGLDRLEAKRPETFNGGGFRYKNAYTNDANDTAYDLTRSTHVLYVEDNWTVNDVLDVTYGLRYERLTTSDAPKLNEGFAKEYGYANTENLDGLDVVLPRFGFKYYLSDEVTIRGGVGRYSGGKPNVWIANSFTNDGITFVELDSDVSSDLVRDPANVDFTRVPQVAQDALVSGTGSTNYVDPNYKMPTDWRFQLGAEIDLDIPYLGEDYKWNVEANYVKQENASFWVDTSRLETGKTTADGQRKIYESRYAGDKSLEDNFDIMLTNADDNGRSVILTTSLQKEWDNGIRMNMSYTHQDITEGNPGTSSRAISNYQYNVALNRNEALVGTSNFEIEHRFVLNLGYKTQFVDGYDTTFDLFFSRRSGRPYTYTLGLYQDDDFGDQTAAYSNTVYQVYLPSGADDPNVDFENSRLTYDEMKAIMDEAGLSKYAGGYAPKNSHTQPWTTTLDLNIRQEIPGFTEDHKGLFYVSIKNLANLLNDDWGQVYRMRFPQQALWDLRGVNDEGQYQYGERFRGTDVRNYNEFYPEASTWRIKMGVRYSF
ncbi:TonB-dependent receptor [Psychrobium sp. MM17-31]|uniref:TonB-dependent receptor n=1 Tax=Psychrobium sp. MM17-31 TaxID=2917758 RepID=UPI001EF6843A|nr:TonB-dependent receptor [Psychrobium sp. MM17-31]MCG7531878.1 TonB-dependent receptor [Psychrobium sp. MM17-31]